MSRTRIGRPGRLIPLTLVTALMASVLSLFSAPTGWAEEPAPPPVDSQSAPAEFTTPAVPEDAASPVERSAPAPAAETETSASAEAAEVRQVTGTVTGTEGPLANVQIVVVQFSPEGEGSIETDRTTASGADGGFSLADLGDGTYTLRFALPGYRTVHLGGALEEAQATRFQIPATEALVFDVQLSADAPTVLVGATPTISGAVFAGSTLTAVPGAWTPGATFSYQWYADGKAIAKATGGTFRLTSAQAARRITVKVTGTLATLPAVSRTSAATPKVITAAAPKISGSAVIGSTLTAKPGSWTRSTKLTYQWLADGVAIAGARKPTYRVSSSVAGKQLAVAVAGTLSGYAKVTRSSSPTAKVMLVATPTISGAGSAAVGSPLVAGPGSWTPGVAFSYQWYADGKAISRATGSSFTPTSGQAGKRITVKVTGRLAGFTAASRTSGATGKVMAATPPRMAGTAVVGSTLTVSLGKWTAKTTFSYRWLRDGTAITGASKSSYKLAPADEGHQLSVTVTGKRSGYATVSRTSALSPKVVLAPLPKITGSAVVGSTLTLTAGTWTAGTELSYQWLRSGSVVSGATGTSYLVSTADHDKSIAVRVTGQQVDWPTVTRTSAAAAKVMRTDSPYMSGRRFVLGTVVSAKPGLWSSGTSFTYKWFRNGSAIAKATKATYRITSSDLGKYLTVAVTGHRSGYASATRTSGPAGVANTVEANGYYRVGIDIMPGTYVAQGGRYCLWERRTNNRQDKVGLLVDGSYHGGQTIVTLQKTDKYFYAQDCGTWTPLSDEDGPAYGAFSEGDHAVGIHILPGTYRMEGGPNCAWWRLQTAGIDLFNTIPGQNGLITWGPLHGGQTIVTIEETDKFFTVYGCGWAYPLSPSTSPPKDEVSDGDYAVGNHILRGTWRTTDFDQDCYYELASGFGGTVAEVRDWNMPDENDTELVAVIQDSDLRFTTSGCGTWRRDPAEAAAERSKLADQDKATAAPAPRFAGRGSSAATKAKSRIG